MSYFNARYYDADTGRFITPDPTVPNPFESQSYNRYMFVMGNPISYMDASGFSNTIGGTASYTTMTNPDGEEYEQVTDDSGATYYTGPEEEKEETGSTTTTTTTETPTTETTETETTEPETEEKPRDTGSNNNGGGDSEKNENKFDRTMQSLFPSGAPAPGAMGANPITSGQLASQGYDTEEAIQAANAYNYGYAAGVVTGYGIVFAGSGMATEAMQYAHAKMVATLATETSLQGTGFSASQLISKTYSYLYLYRANKNALANNFVSLSPKQKAEMMKYLGACIKSCQSSPNAYLKLRYLEGFLRSLQNY